VEVERHAGELPPLGCHEPPPGVRGGAGGCP
jgi:hypothetical protein